LLAVFIVLFCIIFALLAIWMGGLAIAY
jgi:hypothetical protein